MFRETIETLTPEQREQLRKLGIGRQKLYHWRQPHGDPMSRLPTEVQVAVVAAITGQSYAALQAEVTLERATPTQRRVLERVLGKLVAGAASFCVGLGIAGVPIADAKAAPTTAMDDHANVSYVNYVVCVSCSPPSPAGVEPLGPRSSRQSAARGLAGLRPVSRRPPLALALP